MVDTIRKSFESINKAIDPEQGIYEAVISTEEVDRIGDRVIASGADVSNFLRNPTIFWAHNYDLPPIAKAISIDVIPGMGLRARFQFPEFGMSEHADTIHRLWAGGFINATSIGFQPKEHKGIDGSASGREFTNWELLEFSLVGIPANASALRLAIKAFEMPSMVMSIPGLPKPIITYFSSENDWTTILSNGSAALDSCTRIYNELLPTIKIGRVLSASNERKLKAAADAINEVLAQLMPEQESFEPFEVKPYPSEHSCRVSEPSKYSEFRRGDRAHEGKTYHVIYGHVKNSDTWEDQAYRYPKDTWTPEQARTHCASHEGKFEAASGEKELPCCGDIEDKDLQITDNPGDQPVIENHEVETDITPTSNDASDTELDTTLLLKHLDTLLENLK